MPNASNELVNWVNIEMNNTRFHKILKHIIILLIFTVFISINNSLAQTHPEIYITNSQKEIFLKRLVDSKKSREMVNELKIHLEPYVERHKTDPEWIVSRLQMYWNTKYVRVYVNGMNFSHGEGSAPVPTVRFSGSRDWATDYLSPKIEDIKPYMDDERGLYLQNRAKDGNPWEWAPPAKTGHIIEGINRKILDLAEESAFLYWLTNDEKYATFASDIFMKYIEGMYYREPPVTFENHGNANVMGLQTFEVIHEGVIEPVSVCYDFLYSYLAKTDKNLTLIQTVFKKWADQEIKYGVADNNWNLMQARYITYLAIALEDDKSYEDGKGQQYYIDQVLNQNSIRQKALKDVVNNFDPNTGIWPESAGYSMLVSNDLLEILCLIDKTSNNNLLEKFPIVEKAILSTFQYLFPNGFTVAFGDAKHSLIRFNALELLIAQFRKYSNTENEILVTKQLKKFIDDGAYKRDRIKSLFQLFFYEDELMDVPSASSFSELQNPLFYSQNVSWIVQHNGYSKENGMMVSENASLGNHSHTNGINIELYAKGMVIAPDCAAGVSYWSEDHRDYYSRFPAHNTVVVDGISDYKNMRGTVAFTVNSVYPPTDSKNPLVGEYTFSDVSFTEPSTNASQQRVIGTVRTSKSSGYFIDIFRSAKNDGRDKKNEYLFHSQGEPVFFTDFNETPLKTEATNELSSSLGDLVGYDYFSEKKAVETGDNFIAHFIMPSVLNEILNVNLWVKGFPGRTVFSVKAPYSRAINSETVPEQLYHQPLPTMIVRQPGEASTRPFVVVIDAYNQNEQNQVSLVNYFSPENTNPFFVGLSVFSKTNRINHIFNDVDSDKINTFQDGKFQGTYGIVTFQDEKLHSLFLGHGKQLEKGLWNIESSEKNGTVLVQINSEGLKINAYQPFKLSFPFPESSGNLTILKTVGQTIDQTFTGKISKKGNIRIAEFDLPALKNVQLTFY